MNIYILKQSQLSEYVTLTANNACYEYGIKCFWWDNGSEYKLFNRKTMKVTEPELIEIMMTEANGGTYVFDTTVWGDANGDKSVTYDDLTMLQNYLNGQVEAVENCDINKDGTVDVLDEALLVEMLEELYNLCSNEENWGNWIDVANGGAAEIVYTENGIQLNVDKTGKNTWDVQIAYKKLTFEQGASYKISFDYTGSPAQNMSFHMMQDYGTYQTYFSQELSYAEETQHYEGVFQMTEATDEKAQIAFDCGASKLGVPYTITIENLVIVKLP